MGVKHTVFLTRQQAEDKYVELKTKPDRKIRTEAVMMEDDELERVLERLNDVEHEGKGFENYVIQE